MIRGRAPLNTLKITTMTARPRTKPMIGEVTSGMSTLSRMPSMFHESIPAAANDAPSSPPISAWLLELGIPARQVIRFQTMAPMRAAATTSWLSIRLVDQAGADGGCHCGTDQRADEVGDRAQRDGVVAGVEHAC